MDQKPRKEQKGKRWNFCIWYEVWTEERVVSAQRLFFCDDKKTDCGVVLFLPGSTVHFSRIKKLIEKLVANPTVRKHYQRDLRFPLDRSYSEYGAFPDEDSN